MNPPKASVFDILENEDVSKFISKNAQYVKIGKKPINLVEVM